MPKFSTVNFVSYLATRVQNWEARRISDKVQVGLHLNSQVFKAVCSSVTARYGPTEFLNGPVCWNGIRHDEKGCYTWFQTTLMGRDSGHYCVIVCLMILTAGNAPLLFLQVAQWRESPRGLILFITGHLKSWRPIVVYGRLQGQPSKFSGVEGGSAWILVVFKVVPRTSTSIGRLVRWSMLGKVVHLMIALLVIVDERRRSRSYQFLTLWGPWTFVRSE